VFGRLRARDHGHRDPRQRRSLLVRARDWIAPGGDAEGVVYGTITMGALLAAESPGRENFPETVASAVLALVAVGIAHAYAAVIAHRLRGGGRRMRAATTAIASRSHAVADGADGEAGASEPASEVPVTPPHGGAEWWSLVAEELAVLRGAVLPLAALVLSWLAGASLSTAIKATLATCAATLVATEVLVDLRARGGPVSITLRVLAGASLGVAVLALYVILHH
jgi:hypothetical protein